MRCLFGPIGGAVQQDVLAAADVGEESEDASGDDDFAWLVAYSKAKKSMTDKEGTGGKKSKAGKVKRDTETVGFIR